jgi:FtsZ-binding cell division protein ZapB
MNGDEPMEEWIKRIKKLFESMIGVLKNPYLIESMSNELDIQLMEITNLKSDNTSLDETLDDLREDIYFLKESEGELQEQLRDVSKSLNSILEKAINKLSELEDCEIYQRLQFIDPEGWSIYRASQEILKLDVFKEFIVEDSMGRFEESDGHDLIGYLEIAAFGDCTYKIVGSMHEVLDSYTIDYESQEYKAYQDELYTLAAKKLMGELYNKEPSIKLEFLQNYMEEFGQIQADQKEEGVQDLGDIKEIDSEVVTIDEVLDEDLEI